MSIPNLTDLPDELLYKIFGYLNFIDRVEARTVNKKMAAFQTRNYPHLFDRIRTAFKSQYIKNTITVAYSKESLYTMYEFVVLTNKIVSRNNTTSIIGRELSKKYAPKFKILYNYVLYIYAQGGFAICNASKYLNLVELLAEITYTNTNFIPCNIGYFRGRSNYISTRHTSQPDIFNKLLAIIFMISNSLGINIYYDTALKHGIYLYTHELRTLENQISKDIDITPPLVPNFVKLFIYSSSYIDYISLPNFDKVDSIKYYRPSRIVNIRKMTHEFLEQLLFYYEADEMYISKKDIHVLRRRIYSEFVKQSQRNDDEVYKQAVIDSHRIILSNEFLRYVWPRD